MAAVRGERYVNRKKRDMTTKYVRVRVVTAKHGYDIEAVAHGGGVFKTVTSAPTKDQAVRIADALIAEPASGIVVYEVEA